MMRKTVHKHKIFKVPELMTAPKNPWDPSEPTSRSQEYKMSKHSNKSQTNERMNARSQLGPRLSHSELTMNKAVRWLIWDG